MGASHSTNGGSDEVQTSCFAKMKSVFTKEKPKKPHIQFRCPNCDKICHKLYPKTEISSSLAFNLGHMWPFDLTSNHRKSNDDNATAPPGACLMCCHCKKPCHIIFSKENESTSKQEEDCLTLASTASYYIDYTADAVKFALGDKIISVSTANVRKVKKFPKKGIKLFCGNCKMHLHTLVQKISDEDNDLEMKSGRTKCSKEATSYALELKCINCGEYTHSIYAYPRENRPDCEIPDPNKNHAEKSFKG